MTIFRKNLTQKIIQKNTYSKTIMLKHTHFDCIFLRATCWKGNLKSEKTCTISVHNINKKYSRWARPFLKKLSRKIHGVRDGDDLTRNIKNVVSSSAFSEWPRKSRGNNGCLYKYVPARSMIHCRATMMEKFPSISCTDCHSGVEPSTAQPALWASRASN